MILSIKKIVRVGGIERGDTKRNETIKTPLGADLTRPFFSFKGEVIL